MSQLTDNNTSLNSILNIINELPNAITIDTTLTQSGKAADAKATGDALAEKVPTSRTINGKALSSNIALVASDVGAAASSHNQAASTITAGTFAGAVTAQTTSQAPATSLLRNSKIVSSETNPSNNGEICWTYE